MKDLSEKIKDFPKKPGVYLMKDARKKVIYVGKAIDLKKRLQDYFTGRDKRSQIEALIAKTKDIEYIITKSEKEALFLEYNLIQEHKPRYNVIFKDNKRYVSIKFSKHKFPGLYMTRQTPNDGSSYFGPYTSSYRCREVISLMRDYFQLRNCKDTFFANRSRPCIQHEINMCTAPCVKLVSKKDYDRQVDAAKMFLNGEVKDLVKVLKQEMDRASTEERYEDAARLRDTITGIGQMIEPQAISGYKKANVDYVGLYKKNNIALFAVLEMRQGVISDYNHIKLRDELNDSSSLIEQFLIGYYLHRDFIPPIISLDFEPKKLVSVLDLLNEKSENKISFKKPLRGKEKERLALAIANAAEFYSQKIKKDNWPGIRESLQKKLKLKQEPDHIECIDISNISGTNAVGSMVAFRFGDPDKSRYRKFKIKTKDSPDDYAMMYEVLTRRFYTGGGAEEVRGQSNSTARRSSVATGSAAPNLPDLLLIDGGKGHLNIAIKALQDIGVTGIPTVAIAKGADRKSDQLFVPGRKNPLKIKKQDPALLFLMKVRDEAHRFAITYYRHRHLKSMGL